MNDGSHSVLHGALTSAIINASSGAELARKRGDDHEAGRLETRASRLRDAARLAEHPGFPRPTPLLRWPRDGGETEAKFRASLARHDALMNHHEHQPT